jgi:hypothetical protein
MMNIASRSTLKTIRTAVLVLSIALLPIASATQASAAQITNRKITLGTSAPSTATSYAFTFTVPTATAIKSASFTACTTASGACTTPSGFVNSSSTLTGQPTNIGAASGWTVNTSTAGSLRLVNASNATAPSASQTVSFSNVTNPTATNATFFLRAATFSDAAWTTGIDTGVVAASTATQIQVSLAVDETLTFCTGTSITGTNCGTATGSTVDLGTGSTTATSSGTSIMAASTNGSSGYSITVAGATLTSGANTITALASGAAASIGTKQFGANLVANTTPSVGTAASGTGTATAAANYNTANTFRFGTGETVASVGGASNANTFTVSYIANIDGLTPPGSYQTTLTYVATANF